MHGYRSNALMYAIIRARDVTRRKIAIILPTKQSDQTTIHYLLNFFIYLAHRAKFENGFVCRVITVKTFITVVSKVPGNFFVHMKAVAGGLSEKII